MHRVAPVVVIAIVWFLSAGCAAPPRPVPAPPTVQAPPCVNWPQLGMTQEEVIAVWGMPRDQRTGWVSQTRLDHWAYRRSQLDPKNTPAPATAHELYMIHFQDGRVTSIANF